MVITAFGVTLLFVALGLATALLAAIHDAIEAWLQRKQFRSIGGGEGGLPLAQRAPRRRRTVPSPVLTASAPTKAAPTAEPSSRPAWYENAQRDIARR